MHEWCEANGVWFDSFVRNGYTMIFCCGGAFDDDVPDIELCDW